MKLFALISILMTLGQAFAQASTSHLIMECKILPKQFSHHDHPPQKFRAYFDDDMTIWKLVYFYAGIPEDKFTRVASGDIFRGMKTHALKSAHFVFDDGTSLSIDFTAGIGLSESDNTIFEGLEDAELKDCVL